MNGGGASSFQAFDWYRMFLGDQASALYLLEVVFRTTVMYVYAIFFARAVGKRGVGQVSPFEFILIIIISSAAGDPMFYPYVPLLHGIVVLTVVILLHRGLGFLTDRSERIEDLTEGEPLLVVEDGRVREGDLPSGLSKRELLMQLRTSGIRDVGEVERAYFEPSGRVSVLKASPGQEKQTESTLPRTSK